ncbi:IS3 family transposase [Neisseriaceae bacterium JH1-16]|nr:IS3 family transposase [Neisseriaceae bacterium JH1-16]
MECALTIPCNPCAIGSPRIYQELKLRGLPVSKAWIWRLMQRHGMRARYKRRYKVTTDSKHALPVASNQLNRQFHTVAPDQVWTTDITYLPTREGWLYLAVVMDLYTRAIVGWAMHHCMQQELVHAALTMAVARRQPQGEVLLHPDRGSKYCAYDYQALLKRHGILPSHSRAGNCWDTQFKITSECRTDLTRAGIGHVTLALTCRSDSGIPRVWPGPASVT